MNFYLNYVLEVPGGEPFLTVPPIYLNYVLDIPGGEPHMPT